MSNIITIPKRGSKTLVLKNDEAGTQTGQNYSDTELARKLREWAIEHSITPEAVNELLKILSKHFGCKLLPKNHEELMNVGTTNQEASGGQASNQAD